MPKKTFKIYCLSTMVFFTLNLSAQTYTGKVIDSKTSEPLPFANVILLNATDSLFVKGTVCDEKGNFALNATDGTYLLKVSFVGYRTEVLHVKNPNIGTISLVDEEKNLSGITVTASRPIIKMEADGISTNVQGS